MYMNNVPEFQGNQQLAKAYIPYQQYRELYKVQEALYRGTMFKELYRPYKKIKPF